MLASLSSCEYSVLDRNRRAVRVSDWLQSLRGGTKKEDAKFFSRPRRPRRAAGRDYLARLTFCVRSIFTRSLTSFSPAISA